MPALEREINAKSGDVRLTIFEGIRTSGKDLLYKHGPCGGQSRKEIKAANQSRASTTTNNK